jgi:hypothetical protein
MRRLIASKHDAVRSARLFQFPHFLAQHAVIFVKRLHFGVQFLGGLDQRRDDLIAFDLLPVLCSFAPGSTWAPTTWWP